MKKIDADFLKLKVMDIWSHNWLLLTAGDQENFNAMTIGWGSIGVMWGKPFIQVVVRPQRYTREYMEQYPTFTVCAFPERYRNALKLLGTKSGRDSDKITESGLSIIASTRVDAPAFKEAELILECKTMYRQDMDLERFIDDDIIRNYPKNDYHRSYYGEIVCIHGAGAYEG